MGKDIRALTPAAREAASWIERNKRTYDRISTYVWEHPETALVEFKSSAKLQQYLSRNGFAIEKGLANMPTAFAAAWGSGKPVVGILAEFDALPNLSQEAGVTEQKPLAAGAPGHGCGHNLIAASGVLAGVALAAAMKKHNIQGTVKVFGTPAEETLVGKVYMNRDGVFDGTDAMITCHPQDWSGVDYKSCLAVDNIKFRFYGKASHAGHAPEAGRSALDGVELMNVGANYMREHIPQDAMLHYVITKGGEAPNIVPAFAEVWYSLRAARRLRLDKIREWLIDIATGAALMTQTRMAYQILTAAYEWLPNRTLIAMGDRIAKLIGPPPFTAEDQRFGAEVARSMGFEIDGEAYSSRLETPNLTRVFPDVEVARISQDVNYTWRFPSLSFGMAAVVKGTPFHSWHATCQTNMPPALKAGLQASKYMTAAGMECLTNPELVAQAWAELHEYVAQFGYTEPVPRDVPVPTFRDF
jgi:aminobenzoyl-glutamate utilization protein B